MMNQFFLFSALTSGLEVVDLNRVNTRNLLSTSGRSVSSKIVISGYANVADKSFGLLALTPEAGDEVWRRPTKARPFKHDCNLVDLDLDGLKECLVVGEKGLFAAINPLNGKSYSYVS